MTAKLVAMCKLILLKLVMIVITTATKIAKKTIKKKTDKT
jgi:hypothetical protein